MGGSLTSSSLPNPCCSVVTAADLSRASHQRPRKRLSGSSSESFNEMNMLSQVNMSGLRAATDEHRERGRRIGWVFLLTVCFAVMVVSLGHNWAKYVIMTFNPTYFLFHIRWETFFELRRNNVPYGPPMMSQEKTP